jgi:prepilin-type processing-associated H-X9-DG protein
MSWHRGTNRTGFSALELLVVIGILVILISIFVPYLLKLRENDHRYLCAANLRNVGAALSEYANSVSLRNGGDYPRVTYDPVANPDGYRCYSGADAADPFAKETAVMSSDVTASLWLLVRMNLAQPEDFICPSTDDSADRFEDAADRKVSVTRRGNFRSPTNLSYSYASPFSAAIGYRLSSDSLKADFAVMADRNPGVLPPPIDAPPLKLAAGNSRNHDQAGQNVLYADGHVDFQATPYCGVEHDNIYTALTVTPLVKGQTPPADGIGVVRKDVGPAWPGDSYLVPTAADGVEAPVVVVPATVPVTVPATAPMIVPTTAAVIVPTSRPATMPATRLTTAPTTRPATAPATRPTTR